MPPTIDFPTCWPNGLGQVVKQLIASTPKHSPKAQINLGQDLGLRIRNWPDRLEQAYTFVQQRYPQVFQAANQLLKSLPPLNFANPLTVNVGNTLADTKFNQLVIFGDSLSDTGNLFRASGGLFPPAPFFQGRLSDGPLWLESFAPNLGITQIANFAVAGATTGRDNVATRSITQPLPPGQSLPKFPGILDEIDLFATQLAQSGIPKANPKALFVVWGGANDFLTLPTDPIAAIQSVIQSVSNVGTAVTKLAGLGAKTIVVPNLPNLGLTPFATSRNLVPQATAFSTAFNTLLQGTLGTLEQNLGIDLIQVDVFSLVQSITQRPAEFGFTNITSPLFQQTGPVNPREFAFADDFHPTTAIHQFISEAVQRSITTPQPSKVFKTTRSVVRELVNSSGFQASANTILNSFSRDLGANPLLANAATLLGNRLLPQ